MEMGVHSFWRKGMFIQEAHLLSVFLLLLLFLSPIERLICMIPAPGCGKVRAAASLKTALFLFARITSATAY